MIEAIMILPSLASGRHKVSILSPVWRIIPFPLILGRSRDMDITIHNLFKEVAVTIILAQLQNRETSFSFFKESYQSIFSASLFAWFFISLISLLYTIFRLAQSLYAIRAAMGSNEIDRNEYQHCPVRNLPVPAFVIHECFYRVSRGSSILDSR